MTNSDCNKNIQDTPPSSFIPTGREELLPDERSEPDEIGEKSEEVQAIIEGGASPYAAAVRTLNDLAQKIRTERFRNGAIDFSTEEVRFQLNEKGEPVGVEPVAYTESHQLIEEFMLLANRTVAEFVAKARKGEKTR